MYNRPWKTEIKLSTWISVNLSIVGAPSAGLEGKWLKIGGRYKSGLVN